MPKAKTQAQKLSATVAISVASQKSQKANVAKSVTKKTPVSPISAAKSTKASKNEETKIQSPKVPIKSASKKISKDDSKANAKVVTTKKSPAPVFHKQDAQKKSQPADPKKPITAFAVFQAEMHLTMKNVGNFKNLTKDEKSQVIKDSWKKLTDEQKQIYNDKAKADKDRYRAECKQLEQQNSKKTATKSQAAASSSSTVVIVDKDATQPKRPLSAFFFFSMQNQGNLKQQNPDIKITERAKLNGEQWNKMTEEEKQPYQKLHDQDVVRYDKEMKQMHKLGYFINSDGVKSTFLTKKGKAKEFEDGTVMPKKVKTAYMVFFCDFYADKKNTTIGQSVTETAKLIAEKWNSLNPKQKQKYESLSQKDQERYENQLNEIRKNGFFTTEDGVKSTDLPQKKPKRPASKGPQNADEPPKKRAKKSS